MTAEHKPHMRWNAGPFRMPRVLYRLGFDWLEEFEFVEGYDIGTAHLPEWASSRPGAGIIGTWRRTRRRLQWFFVPLTPWLRDA